MRALRPQHQVEASRCFSDKAYYALEEISALALNQLLLF